MSPEAFKRWQAAVAATKADLARGVAQKAVPITELVARTAPAPRPVMPVPELPAIVGSAERRPRAATFSPKALRRDAKRDTRLGVAEPRLTLAELAEKPKTRGDCCEGPRPCPYVSCRHHNALDVGPGGSIKHNFPDIEPDELEHSCSLDVADRGGVTLEEVGVVLNVTRERVRQMETKALARAAALIEAKPGTGVWLKQCKARDAETGRQCGLLEPHAPPHRHGKNDFVRLLVDGQRPQRDEPDAWQRRGLATDGVA